MTPTIRHTPGPWIAEGALVYKLQPGNIVSKGNVLEENRFYAGVQGAPLTPKAELEANAKLMAAAPTLLQAIQHLLEDALAMGMATTPMSGSVIEARNAIAKAVQP